MILENIQGTQVLFVKNASQIVNIQILVNTGSSNENAMQYGIAHFLEHMSFKGTIKRDAKRINRDADLMGAKLNAWTWHDQTSYHLNVMTEKFEEGFELLSDIYQYSTFPAEEFEKERSVIISETRRYEDDPPMYLSDIAVDHFCDNGLAHKVIGPEESIKKLALNQLTDFRKEYYCSNNILISIVGNIEFQEVKQVIEKYFIHNIASSVAKKLPVSTYRSGELNLTKSDIQEAQYQLYYPALPYLDNQAVAQGVMTFVLGGNASSVLFERLREELGLCYGIYARPNRFEGFNYIDITSSCAASDLDLMHSEVMNIIKNLTVEKISLERLEMVKASLLSSLYMNIESSAGLNSYLSLAYLRGEKEDIINKRVSDIKAVTISDVIESAAQTFAVEPLVAKLTSSNG